jgi:ADP-heptose:LPS heptosyltransferase
LIEQIAAVGDYLVALEIYRAAVQRWPNVKITLRNRARVIEQSWRG